MDVRERDGWDGGLLDGLLELTPGPGLAVALESVDRAAVDPAELIDLVRVRARQIAHEQAQLLLDIHAAAPVLFASVRPETRTSDANRYAAEVIGDAVGWSHTYAQGQIDLADRLVEDLPMVLAALDEGRIDVGRAGGFVDALASVADRELAQCIAVLLLRRAQRWTLPELRERLRYHIDRKDPRGSRRRYRKRVADRNVSLRQGQDGTAVISAYNLPPHRAAAAYDRVDRLARAARGAGDARTLGQLRGDALLDLLTGTPFQLAPSLDPDTAHGDAAEADAGHRGDDNPWRDPALTDLYGDDPDDREDRVGAYDYQTATIRDDDRAWVSAGADSRFETGNWAPAGSGWGVGASARLPGGRFGDLGVLPADRCHCGRLLPAQREGTLDVTVALATLAGRDEHPALIAGLGPVSAQIARQIALDGHADPVWRYSVLDEHGEVRHHGLITRRPASVSRSETTKTTSADVDRLCACPRIQPGQRRGVIDIHLTEAMLADPAGLPGWAAVIADIAADIAADAARSRSAQAYTQRHFNAEEAAFIRARDRTCRAPHCRTPAAKCELDHTIPHGQGGASHRDNGNCLCKRHHRMRHSPGFRRGQHGSHVTWTFPNRRTYHVGIDKDIALTRDDEEN